MDGALNGYEWNGAEHAGFPTISMVTDRVSDLYTQRSITDRISRVVTLGQIIGDTDLYSSENAAVIVSGMAIAACSFDADVRATLTYGVAPIAPSPITISVSCIASFAGGFTASAVFSESASVSVTHTGAAIASAEFSAITAASLTAVGVAA